MLKRRGGRFSLIRSAPRMVAPSTLASMPRPHHRVRDAKEVEAPDPDEVELAEELWAAWDEGRGVSKSELERITWNDGKSHGRRFDRLVRKNLGVPTTRPAKQTDQIASLKKQIRSLGQHPVGWEPTDVEIQLQHSRAACMASLAIWNDPSRHFELAGSLFNSSRPGTVCFSPF